MSRLEKESSFSNVASTSQEGRGEVPGLDLNRKFQVTLLSSEWQSSKGGLSTINRELAIQLAKHPDLEVSVYLPQCSEDDKKVASSHNVQLIEADELTGFDPIEWLAVAPPNHVMDYVVGHGVLLGRYAQIIKRRHHCKWIQVVHTAPEELGKYKTYANAISKGEEKHQAEVKLCEMADQVVAVGPKLKEAFSRYLRSCQKDQAVVNLTPSIFSEFSHVKQSPEERETFVVLVLGRGDSEDFQLKGYDIVAQAIAQLSGSYHLMFVGAPGGKEDEVAQKLLEHNISRSHLTVRCFNENREQLAKLFCEVDLATMPSRTEGFGLVALEALSASLPVLVSGNSGLGEALKKVPYGSHCVVDSENPQDWANAIRSVREKNRELRLEEIKFLSEKYAKKFSWDKQCELLVERMRNISPGTAADEHDSPVEGRCRSTGNLQANQGVASSTSLDEGSSERLALKKSKRSLSHSDSSPPKRNRLATDVYEDHKNEVKILKAEYKRRSLVKPLPWYNSIQLPLEDVYTRLKIVSRRKTDFRLENNVVNLCDIFESFNKGEDTMTLVEGSPGIGKTMFCLKVAYDWANEKTELKENLHVLHRLEFVLLLKCRDIEGDLMEAISEQLLPEDMDQKAKNEFMDYIKDIHNQENILIILDGLDELPEKSKDHVDKLLNRRILPFCYVLATCRQERGISARAEFKFDVLLQIEGFTEENAFEYIRKHFEIVCPEQALNVEKLIQQIQENTLLHALCTNPLNLLLLCVVFEDYEEKLPSSRTKLYQIIVHCVLRRYCAKHKLKAPDDDNALEEQFQESILVLGELAWTCLLTDRHSFREAELTNFESVTKDLAARFLGFVFKEASLKRIKPQHEYYFLHKTFQEYLAALYLVHLLLREQNVFEHFNLDFGDIVRKYRQVFLFVIGVLDKEASILFRQIGEVLRSDWDWLGCKEEEATFFTESFSESGNAEQMAVTLCSYIPFPQNIEIVHSFECFPENLVLVLKACKTFPQLQLPVSLSVLDAESLEDDEVDTIKDALVSCLPLQTLVISGHEMTTSLATALYEGLSENSTLSWFSLDVLRSIPANVAEVIGNGLAVSETLTTVVFTLTEEWDEAWASALERGLSAETPLESVILKIDGSMSDTAINALVKVLFNESLFSLCLVILGEMQDSLASAVSEGLAAVTVLKSFSVVVFGELTHYGAFTLENGFLKNHSLNSVGVKVYGELPSNWTTVVQNVFSSKKSLMFCDFHPNPINQVTDTQINHLHPVVLDSRLISEHSLTLNLWGELNCVGAEALGKVLRESSLSILTLNVHGKLADDVADCLARFLKPHKTLSSVTVNIWCELTEKGKAVLQGMSNNTHIHSFALDYQSQPSEDSFSRGLDLSVDVPLKLTETFCKVKESQTRTLSLTINNHSDTGEEWAHGLNDGLAENSLLTMLTLTINNFSDVSGDWAHGLSDGLAENSSLTTLILIINNFSDVSGKWGYALGNVLAKFASLTELSLVIDDHSKTSEFKGNLANSLTANTSLTTLSITINCGNMTTFWRGLGDCLRQTMSLTTLSLTINNYSDISGDWTDGMDIGLAKTSSITTLKLVVNNYSDMWGIWGHWLRGGLAGNTSLTTLSLQFNNYSLCCNDMSGQWADGLAYGLANNTSLTTLCLAISDYGNTSGEWADSLGKALVTNTSLTTLTLTINNVAHSEVSGDWLQSLFNKLSKSESLTTLKFTVNNQGAYGGNLACSFDLRNCLAKCQSLTSLDVTVSLYGVAN